MCDGSKLSRSDIKRVKFGKSLAITRINIETAFFVLSSLSLEMYTTTHIE